MGTLLLKQTTEDCSSNYGIAQDLFSVCAVAAGPLKPTVEGDASLWTEADETQIEQRSGTTSSLLLCHHLPSRSKKL